MENKFMLMSVFLRLPCWSLAPRTKKSHTLSLHTYIAKLHTLATICRWKDYKWCLLKMEIIGTLQTLLQRCRRLVVQIYNLSVIGQKAYWIFLLFWKFHNNNNKKKAFVLLFCSGVPFCLGSKACLIQKHLLQSQVAGSGISPMQN